MDGALLTGNVWAAVGALTATLTLVLVVKEQARASRKLRDANKPPFCAYCGISAHEPKEQTRLACPRNPNGPGHKYEVEL